MIAGTELAISVVLLSSFMGTTLHIIRFEDLDLSHHVLPVQILLYPGVLFMTLYLISIDLTNRFLSETFDNKALAALIGATVCVGAGAITMDQPIGPTTLFMVMSFLGLFTVAQMTDDTTMVTVE